MHPGRDAISVTLHKAVGRSEGKWDALAWTLAAQV